MDGSKVITLYTEKGFTLRRIAKEFNTNHHRIKRILQKNGIEITQKGRVREPFTDEHKRKISEACKGRKTWSEGKRMTRDHIIKNMIAHIKYDVDYGFINQFEDIEKVKILNRLLVRDRVSAHFDTGKYKQFITVFYYDKQFNAIYDKWNNRKNKWYAPSLDHKHPLSRGGSYEIDNLQILTWFENRAKAEMTQAEWETFKHETNTSSDLFI